MGKATTWYKLRLRAAEQRGYDIPIATVARRVGCSREALALIERGVSQPTFWIVRGLLNYYGLAIVDRQTGEEINFEEE